MKKFVAVVVVVCLTILPNAVMAKDDFENFIIQALQNNDDTITHLKYISKKHKKSDIGWLAIALMRNTSHFTTILLTTLNYMSGIRKEKNANTLTKSFLVFLKIIKPAIDIIQVYNDTSISVKFFSENDKNFFRKTEHYIDSYSVTGILVGVACYLGCLYLTRRMGE
ncbi:MAG: hypothetical protein LBQ10_03855 [Desulfovibrio sp.]|jgi:hypothetical protein|nr:hypothetical protein [Desulfovibrio sp.]